MLAATERDVTTSSSCPPCWKCRNMFVYTIRCIYFYAAYNIQSSYICQR